MNDKRVQAATRRMADGMARICRLYGVNPLAGRLFAALFASTEPRALEALGAEVGAAKSTVSVALRKLEAARVVRRLPPGTDRRDYYQLVEDPWQVLGDWARLYFTPELEMARETTAGLRAALGDAEPARRAALEARIDAWRAFVEVLAGALDGLAPGAAPVTPARRIPVAVEDPP